MIRPGAIGDVILSLPALEQARADYTEVWVPRNMLTLVRFAEQVRAIADTGLDWIGVVEDHRIGPALRLLGEFDSIYSWYGANRPEFREAVRHLPFTFFPALPPPPGIPRIVVPAKTRGRRVIVHPFASSPAKRWPMEDFERLAAHFPDVAWCAGPAEDLPRAQRFDDLYHLACWLAEAGAYVGNDSGIAHLAAAVGTPVVSIFLTTDPAVWAPRGHSDEGRLAGSSDRVSVLVRPHWRDVQAAVHRYIR